MEGSQLAKIWRIVVGSVERSGSVMPLSVEKWSALDVELAETGRAQSPQGGQERRLQRHNCLLLGSDALPRSRRAVAHRGVENS